MADEQTQASETPSGSDGAVVGVLAEFASVAEAVDAAVEAQRATAGGALILRIGINLGDVIVTDDERAPGLLERHPLPALNVTLA